MPENTNTDIQNILKNIGKSQRVAIILPTQITLDSLCSAIAFQAGLSSYPDKPISSTLFSSNMALPETKFLSIAPKVYTSLNNTNQLAIKISNLHAQPEELRYEKSADGLTVFITPDNNSQFEDGDVSVLPSATNFDLVIILGSANLEQLGKIYTDNAKLFFETQTINIDCNPDNEYFGTINLVNPNASSLSEVTMDILEAISGVLNNNILSTSLLAGIISKTGSFRDPKTTPQALLKASRLVAAGAHQQDIIQHLFKTKPLPLLQLWGRALARLTAFPEKKALTAVVTTSDLEKTKVSIESLPLVLRDIIEMVTGYSLVVLLAETAPNKVRVLFAGMPFENLSKLATEFSTTIGAPALIKIELLTGKFELATFNVESNLEATQQKLKELIEKRNSVV